MPPKRKTTTVRRKSRKTTKRRRSTKRKGMYSKKAKGPSVPRRESPPPEQLELPREVDIKTERPVLSAELKTLCTQKLNKVFGFDRFLSVYQKMAIMLTLKRKLSFL